MKIEHSFIRCCHTHTQGKKTCLQTLWSYFCFTILMNNYAFSLFKFASRFFSIVFVFACIYRGTSLAKDFCVFLFGCKKMEIRKTKLKNLKAILFASYVSSGHSRLIVDLLVFDAFYLAKMWVRWNDYLCCCFFNLMLVLVFNEPPKKYSETSGSKILLTIDVAVSWVTAPLRFSCIYYVI